MDCTKIPKNKNLLKNSVNLKHKNCLDDIYKNVILYIYSILLEYFASKCYDDLLKPKHIYFSCFLLIPCVLWYTCRIWLCIQANFQIETPLPTPNVNIKNH
ncbi:hypothetical protein ACJX0J_006988 [Zea mays]